jgi:hypothetical protein
MESTEASTLIVDVVTLPGDDADRRDQGGVDRARARVSDVSASSRGRAASLMLERSRRAMRCRRTSRARWRR